MKATENKLFNIEFTYEEDREKAFSYNLEITTETSDIIFAKSNLYGDIYKFNKITEELEINGKSVGYADRWWIEII